MPPITIQTDKPINTTAAKPDATTPKTASGPTSFAQQPTSTSSTTSSYTPAAPGAAAFPAPTSSIPPVQTQAVPSPTRTSAYTPQSYHPPPPQPGAVPSPQDALPQGASRQDIPPPPRAGAAPIPPQLTGSATTLPPQMSYAPPTQNAAPSYSTTTYQPPSNTFSPIAAMPQAAADMSHPPGYVQDPNADTMSPAQRAATEKAAQEDSVLHFGSGSENKSGAGLLESAGAGTSWDRAKKWMGEVGGKVAELEGEVWKKIDGK